MEERIQKIISNLGMASRRAAEEFIAGGRVTVNGKTAVLGTKADPEIDHIKLDGKLISVRPAIRLYVKLYKPREVITSLIDPEGRPTVMDFIRAIKHRIYPVGRLDYHSEGLLLLTNDGEFAQKVLHPSVKILKTYHVKLNGILEEAELEKLRRGIVLDDGPTAPAIVKRLGATRGGENEWIEIAIHEGRKRQVRRMMERLKHHVMKLKRVSINGIGLGELKPGQWDYLTQREFRAISMEIEKSATVEKSAEVKSPPRVGNSRRLENPRQAK
jgi:23S rRNA pseudouridine2605 synthase